MRRSIRWFPACFDNSAKIIEPPPYRDAHLLSLELRLQCTAAVLAREEQRTLVRGALLDHVQQHFTRSPAQVSLPEIVPIEHIDQYQSSSVIRRIPLPRCAGQSAAISHCIECHHAVSFLQQTSQEPPHHPCLASATIADYQQTLWPILPTQHTRYP
jgi:hypothetical protein